MKKQRINVGNAHNQTATSFAASIPKLLLNPPFHVLLIVIAGVAVYANTLWVPLLLDDITSISVNPILREFHFSFKPRIIGELSFALNYHLHENHVAGYHIFNIIIHLLNGTLVYTLLRLLLKTQYMSKTVSQNKSACLIPLCAALFFTCHPVQTQAVTYIRSLKNSLYLRPL